MNNFILPQQPLGKTGLLVSIAGLGTVKFGRNQGVKYPKRFELPNDNTILSLLEQAQALGINWLDTAPAYGNSEARLGKLIHREKWILASKTGENFHHGQSSFNFSAKHTTASIEQSLRSLRTDYIDLLCIHSDGNDEYIIKQTDCLDALYHAKKIGKIRAIGMSCKSLEGALSAMEWVDFLMLSFNPHDHAILPAIRQAQREKKGIIIKKGFGNGHLLQQYSLNSLTDYIFQEPVTALITATLDSKHLLQNCFAINQSYHAHRL